MEPVLTDFYTRVKEVNKYFHFLKQLSTEKTKLAVLENSGEHKIKPRNVECRYKTLHI